MDETQRFDVADRVAESKARLQDKLAELARRVDAVRHAARPMKTATRPWVLFGAAFAVGFMLGRRPPRRPVGVTPERPLAVRGQPGILGALVREILLATAAAYARKFIEGREPSLEGTP